MLSHNITCIIQARTQSSRLPNKILLDGFKKSLIEHQIERIKFSKFIKKIIIATTTNKKDDILYNRLKKNVPIFRGSENDVLKRFYECAKKNNCHNIIRITADCPLIDHQFIDKVINYYLNNSCDYVSNVNTNYLPDGFHCEIFNFNSLKKAHKLAISKFDREHVTPFIWSNPDIFSIKNFYEKKKYCSSKIRLTLDYVEDYILIKTIFDNLYKKNKKFNLNTILHFLKKNSYLTNINQRYHNLQNIKFHWRRKFYS